ncbi:hypothetical protein JCM30471_35860 [Desulfuromonas carbonis]
MLHEESGASEGVPLSSCKLPGWLAAVKLDDLLLVDLCSELLALLQLATMLPGRGAAAFKKAIGRGWFSRATSVPSFQSRQPRGTYPAFSSSTVLNSGSMRFLITRQPSRR